MSGSRVYSFHQCEIEDLTGAANSTISVCADLKCFLKGVRDNQPKMAAEGIRRLFLPTKSFSNTGLNKVKQLIQPVSISVKVPRPVELELWSDEIPIEEPPMTIEMCEEPLAHFAVWEMYGTFVKYLWSVWRRGNSWIIFTVEDPRIKEERVEMLVEWCVDSRWQEIRDELRPFFDFDCDNLRQAVEAESWAAMDRCRQSIVGNGAISTELNVFVPTPLQAAILDVLDGKAMKKQALADEVCGGEGTRLYRKGGINELRETGRVDHKHGVGYFRPDAPPLH